MQATCIVLLGVIRTVARALPDRASSNPDSPSVLLITIDTLRADHLGCYGYHRIQTPAIDRLASDAVRFEEAYAQVPITLPSHAVILTGTYPMFNGVRDFTSSGLAATIPTLAEIMRAKGYHTAAFVSSYVLNSMWGLNRGFDVYDDDVGIDPGRSGDLFQLERRGDRTVDRMLDWLDHQKTKPFFVWLHLYDPHSPYNPPEPFRSKYPEHPYDGEIAFDDGQIGRVITRLRDLNLYDGMIVLLLSDHGESLGEHGEAEHGFFIYNSTLRTPLIIKLPGNAKAGKTVSQPVGTIDVAPTLAQLCGIPASLSRSFQGRSLWRLMDGNKPGGDETVYAESYYPRGSFGWHELRGLVTPRFKFIDAPRPELYDLARDSGEQSNLAGRNTAIVTSLREKLEDFTERFRAGRTSSATKPLDPEVLEKLKSLGYVGYQAPAATSSDKNLEDPKDKIETLNRILRAGDLLRMNKHAEADALLANLEKSDPDLYVIPFERGENYLRWGKSQEASAEFLKALWMNPTFDQAALGLGRAYFQLGQDEQAATALELALKLSPNNFLARLALAKVYWRQNLPEKAEPELAQVVAAHPRLAEAHADYGVILARLGRYRQALPEIERGIEFGYRDAITYNFLGLTFAALGENAKALQAYKQAIELNPHYAAAYLNLALQYRKQNEPHEAQVNYRKVCELSDALCRQYARQFSNSNQ